KIRVVLLACGSFNPITNMHLRMFELARDHLEETGRYSVVKGIISPVGDAYKKKGLIEACHRVKMARLATESSSWISVDDWECQQAEWVETAKVIRLSKKRRLEKRKESSSAHNRSVTWSKSILSKPALMLCRSMSPFFDCFHKNLGGPPQVFGDFFFGISPANSIKPLPHEGIFHCYSTESFQLKLLCGADVLESFSIPNLWKKEDIEEIVGRFGLVCITRNGCDAEKFVYESDVLHEHRKNIHIVREWVTNEISATHVRRAVRRGQSVRYLLPEPVVQYIKDQHLY
ncbi:nicotinamide nucleotide adenylyltransferase 1, partial [Silurus asotus]